MWLHGAPAAVALARAGERARAGAERAAHHRRLELALESRVAVLAAPLHGPRAAVPRRQAAVRVRDRPAHAAEPALQPCHLRRRAPPQVVDERVPVPHEGRLRYSDDRVVVRERRREWERQTIGDDDGDAAGEERREESLGRRRVAARDRAEGRLAEAARDEDASAAFFRKSALMRIGFSAIAKYRSYLRAAAWPSARTTVRRSV